MNFIKTAFTLCRQEQMRDTIRKFKTLLDEEEKRKIPVLGLITIFGAFLEMLGVSMAVPLVTAILGKGRETALKYIVLMVLVFLGKELFLIFETRYRTNFVYESRLRMQKKVLHAVLGKPYEYFLSEGTPEILRLIQNDVAGTYSLLMTLLSLVSESVVTAALIIAVLRIEPLMTVLIACILAVLITVIIKCIRPVLKKQGEESRKNRTAAYKWLLQSIYGIKEIKVSSRESYFEESYARAGDNAVEAEKKYAMISSIPRSIIELGCVCSALGALAVMILMGRDMETLVPAAAAFAVAAVRLMPAAYRLVNTAGAAAYHGPGMDRLLQVLAANDASGKHREADGAAERSPEGAAASRITLDREVCLDHVTYRYPESGELVLENASLTVPAGSTVGITGISGAGKTTAADLLLGLLPPQSGQVLADGTDIQTNLAGWFGLAGYIPQSIFLLNGTIRENVVFGAEEDSEEKVWKALEEAQLADFVRKQPDGLETKVGERGIRLSGGQRQRVGIARALYTDPAFLVFDEATSSLDTETESAILSSLKALHGKKTLVIIAHRPQTTENCDVIYRIENGQAVLMPCGQKSR